ncbi:MAG: MarR family winged helix-turn-helix transcriptional regulator [Beijerinckiaceae bacterium]|nr:MarR family winged helix-turn-helix transcriptional regulator [Beijerinckiaceae bacterium]
MSLQTTREPDSLPPFPPGRALSEAEYAALAHFRHALRQVTAFNDGMLASAGLGPRRYQALLAIRASSGRSGFSVGDLADELIIKPNTAAELANRLEDAGLIRRVRDSRDRRRALLELTAEGLARLDGVAHVHFAKLQESRAVFMSLFGSAEPPGGPREQT